MNNQNQDRNKKYRKKYKNLKRRIKNLVFENAALCDEVAKIQEDIHIVKEERRFLYYKVLEHEGDSDDFQSESVTAINGAKTEPKKRHSLEDNGKNTSSLT